MTTISITIDPTNPTDIDKARAFLDQLGGNTIQLVTSAETLRQKIIALLRGYGEKRVNYIRLVAEASPDRAHYDDIAAVVGSPKAVGGTHSAIERAWRAKGVAGPLIDTDINGDARMDPALAALVLEVLHEQDEADPLELARY